MIFIKSQDSNNLACLSKQICQILNLGIKIQYQGQVQSKGMKGYFFFKESIKNMKTSATVTRSSKHVCKKIIQYVDFENADVIVELGAGDGVITEHLLASMGPNTKLISFEILDQFCDKLRAIDDDRLIVVNDSAEHLNKYLKENGFDKAYDVVSAIPFVALPKELSKKILKEVKRNIRKGGNFSQLHYSTLVKGIYEDIFGEVKTEFVPLNIPPAFLHFCKG